MVAFQKGVGGVFSWEVVAEGGGFFSWEVVAEGGVFFHGKS